MSAVNVDVLGRANLGRRRLLLSDSAMLGKVTVGDKVRFVAANAGGKLTITEILPAK